MGMLEEEEMCSTVRVCLCRLPPNVEISYEIVCGRRTPISVISAKFSPCHAALCYFPLPSHTLLPSHFATSSIRHPLPAVPLLSPSHLPPLLP